MERIFIVAPDAMIVIVVFHCEQQAQRRILEEQYAVKPPAKASRGPAASLPPVAAPQQAVKCIAPDPEKIPEAVTASEVEMKAVALEPEGQSPTAAGAGAADTGGGDPPADAEAAEAEADVADTEADAQVRRKSSKTTLERCRRLKRCRRQRPVWRQRERKGTRAAVLQEDIRMQKEFQV